MDSKIGMSARPLGSSAIEERVLNILRDILVLEEQFIDLDSVITEDIAPDSLDQMRLYMALEDEFEETIPEKKMEEIKTVRDIVNYIKANSGGA